MFAQELPGTAAGMIDVSPATLVRTFQPKQEWSFNLFLEAMSLLFLYTICEI